MRWRRLFSKDRPAKDPDSMKLLVAWLPSSPGGSLSTGARSLVPALLYADEVIVVSPEADDSMEMSDYFDLDDALPGTVDFRALTSSYAVLDERGKPVKGRRGQYYYEPLSPKVWTELAEDFAAKCQQALDEGDSATAIRQLARLEALTDGAHKFEID